MATRMSDLPPELVGEEIFTRIPIISLRAVRSTCKLWESLSKNSILGKKAEQFLGFMTMNNKICSLRFDLREFKDVEVDLSIKQVELLDDIDISKVFQCDGLLLCVTKDNSRFLVWNPYLGQTRCIRPRINFYSLDRYALGYEYDKKKKKRNHKILRFLDYPNDSKHVLIGYEIYDFSSNSWRVLDVNSDWEIEYYQPGVSLKGNTYCFAQEKIELGESLLIFEREDFLLCFDFTTERFGPRLPLPFHSYIGETVTLSCVREEQFAALLYQRCGSLEIWVTSNIEHNTLSWTKFLKLDMGPFIGSQFNYKYASFFIDEEEKVAVVFSLDRLVHYHRAFIIGDDGYFKSLRLGEVRDISDPSDPSPVYCPPLVCSSSYLPSIVHNKPPRKRKRKHLDD